MNPRNLSSYRQISNLSFLSKVIEKVSFPDSANHGDDHHLSSSELAVHTIPRRQPLWAFLTIW